MTPDRVTDILYESEAALRLVSSELTALTAPAAGGELRTGHPSGTPRVDGFREWPSELPEVLHVAHDEVLAGLELLRHSLLLIDQTAQAPSPDTARPDTAARNLSHVASLSRDLEARLITVQHLLDELALAAAADALRISTGSR